MTSTEMGAIPNRELTRVNWGQKAKKLLKEVKRITYKLDLEGFDPATWKYRIFIEGSEELKDYMVEKISKEKNLYKNNAVAILEIETYMNRNSMAEFVNVYTTSTTVSLIALFKRIYQSYQDSVKCQDIRGIRANVNMQELKSREQKVITTSNGKHLFIGKNIISEENKENSILEMKIYVNKHPPCNMTDIDVTRKEVKPSVWKESILKKIESINAKVELLSKVKNFGKLLLNLKLCLYYDTSKAIAVFSEKRASIDNTIKASKEIKSFCASYLQIIFPAYAEFQDIIKYLPNWKASGCNGIYNFFIKKYVPLHPFIYTCIKEVYLDGKTLESWFYKGITYLIPKGTPTRGSDFRPITCMSNLYKLATKCTTKPSIRRIATPLKLCGLIPYLSFILHKEVKSFSMNSKISTSHSKTVAHRDKVRIKNDFGKKIERGILQDDSLSPLLFVLYMDPLSRKLNLKYPKVGVRIDTQSFVNRKKSAINCIGCEEDVVALEGSQGYKYLDITEDSTIERLCMTKLNACNLVINYHKGLLKLELEEHKKHNFEIRQRLYLSKSEMGRGLVCVKHRSENMLLNKYNSLSKTKNSSLRRVAILKLKEDNKSHLLHIVGYLKTMYELAGIVIPKMLIIKKRTNHEKLFKAKDHELLSIKGNNQARSETTKDNTMDYLATKFKCIHLLLCKKYGLKKTNKIRSHSVQLKNLIVEVDINKQDLFTIIHQAAKNTNILRSIYLNDAGEEEVERKVEKLVESNYKYMEWKIMIKKCHKISSVPEHEAS
ncbi:hypothetical protein NAPIS_ORF02093 [Vairimorpha apis BRL 01]|uniref:Reverse transcriptase domain-containing protein n=1 Tax=Vairimorpha apis BRL 01 TaxID=1037528 RepID=T0MA89_9MICR|nr:hypothetical protein NAPIS_ORF02093 [Vairimorpha apis BRL 01]